MLSVLFSKEAILITAVFKTNTHRRKNYSKMNNILIIAPHADDELLGCGATIAKKIDNGDNVYVLVMTNAHIGAPELFSEDNIYTVRAEAKKAHAFLGIKETVFLDFPAPKLDQHPSYQMSIEIS